ncbi:MAG: sigma-70 family RNA polymerase sigma factor [Planctomycetes bacterium]|nr:sigma-70 family RNA polymerase sigma factor [Planctomycetota bacterium]
MAMDKRDRVDEFVRLFTEFEPRVHAYVLSLVPDWTEAEEVLQETNAVLWQKFDDFEPGSNFFAWACQIVRYKVLEHQRRRARTGMHLSEQAMEAIESNTIDMADELGARQRALSSCLAKLSPADRDLIEQRYAEGATTQSVARSVGRSVDAIYKAVNRIRRALGECVSRAMRLEGEA